MNLHVMFDKAIARLLSTVKAALAVICTPTPTRAS